MYLSLRVLERADPGRIVFTQDVTERLRSLLRGSATLGENAQTRTEPTPVTDTGKASQAEAMSGFKTTGFKSSFKPAEPDLKPAPTAEPDDADLDGHPMELDADMNGQVLDDVDGEVIDDVDGEAMDDLDGEALEDTDGERLQPHSVYDVDGASMGDDMDGEPL